MEEVHCTAVRADPGYPEKNGGPQCVCVFTDGTVIDQKVFIIIILKEPAPFTPVYLNNMCFALVF